MEQKKLLKVGDILYEYYGYSGSMRRIEVKRVTPTQAECDGGQKVARAIDQYSLTVRKIGVYDSLHLETPARKREYEEQKIIRRAQEIFHNIKIREINFDQALKIIEVFGEKEVATP